MRFNIFRLRFGSGFAHFAMGTQSLNMAMYSVSPRTVRRLVRDAGGRIVREAPHPMLSYRETTYYAQAVPNSSGE